MLHSQQRVQGTSRTCETASVQRHDQFPVRRRGRQRRFQRGQRHFRLSRSFIMAEHERQVTHVSGCSLNRSLLCETQSWLVDTSLAGFFRLSIRRRMLCRRHGGARSGPRPSSPERTL